jgi:hypothetical protein
VLHVAQGSTEPDILPRRCLQADAALTAGNVLAMRRAHATGPDQLELINECTALGWFELDDVTFDSERACVILPFRLDDEEAGVVVAPRELSHFARRWGYRGRDWYAPWRCWLLLIHGAVGLEIHRHTGHEDAQGPWDFLNVTFDSEDSEVVIFTDEPWASVVARVERIDVVVEETAEHFGWGLVNPCSDGVVHPAPPPGSRRINRRSRS